MHDDSTGDEVKLAGSLLLAHPHLKDPNFVRSVILMTAHGDDGSLGVVINQHSGMKLSEVNSEFDIYGLGDVPLYVGGPVNQDQIILAGWELSEATNEFKLYFGMDPQAARDKLLDAPGAQLRAFRGYSGWQQGQLIGELSDNAWVISQMDGQAVCAMQGDILWRHIISRINPELGLLALAPEEPDRN